MKNNTLIPTIVSLALTASVAALIFGVFYDVGFGGCFLAYINTALSTGARTVVEAIGSTAPLIDVLANLASTPL